MPTSNCGRIIRFGSTDGFKTARQIGCRERNDAAAAATLEVIGQARFLDDPIGGTARMRFFQLNAVPDVNFGL